MVYLHILVFQFAAAIGAMTAVFLIDLLPYVFWDRFSFIWHKDSFFVFERKIGMGYIKTFFYFSGIWRPHTGHAPIPHRPLPRYYQGRSSRPFAPNLEIFYCYIAQFFYKKSNVKFALLLFTTYSHLLVRKLSNKLLCTKLGRFLRDPMHLIL